MKKNADSYKPYIEISNQMICQYRTSISLSDIILSSIIKVNRNRRRLS